MGVYDRKEAEREDVKIKILERMAVSFEAISASLENLSEAMALATKSLASLDVQLERMNDGE